KIGMDESEDSLGALEVDYDYAENYLRLLRKLKKDLGLSGKIDVSLFIERPGVIKETREKAISERDWRKIKSTIEAALTEVESSREKEGKRLLADMKKRTKHIRSLVGKIERKSPKTVQARKEELRKKMAELDDSSYGRLRIEEEVAIFAQRCDVVEERVRLRSHLKSLETAFQQDGAVGRRLVFLLQEMNREANTIASKAQDAEISQHVVMIKEELERLREQAENVV
ncbi:MAG: YicC family protein, partial [bacterium]